jgi:hypothetical protein
MSQENVELVRRAYEVFNEGGPEAVISAGIWSPEIVFDFSPSDIPGLGVYRGYGEVRAFFEEDWFKAFPFHAPFEGARQLGAGALPATLQRNGSGRAESPLRLGRDTRTAAPWARLWPSPVSRIGRFPEPPKRVQIGPGGRLRR